MKCFMILIELELKRKPKPGKKKFVRKIFVIHPEEQVVFQLRVFPLR